MLLRHHHPARSRLLHCRGFYRDAIELSYGFIFDFPFAQSTPPVSLYASISERTARYNLKTPKPVLDQCYLLASILSDALFQFHTVGWVHKSLRSENVIFFPRGDGEAEAIDWGGPWLVGFEYAREDPGFSETPGMPGLATNLYRHPDQWGQPTRRFRKSHDIYSLGVILPEIGLWMPVSKLKSDERFFQHSKRYETKEYFIKTAKESLPFRVGMAYTEIVIKCLSGQVDKEPFVDDSGSNNTEMGPEDYQVQISRALRSLCQISGTKGFSGSGPRWLE